MSSQATSAENLRKHAELVLKQHLGHVYNHLQDPDVQEVMINHPGSIWIEKAGQYSRVADGLSAESIVSAITTLANINEKRTTQILDCRLPQLRVAATLSPISHLGPSMCIRRHSARVYSLDDYVASGAFDPTWPAESHGGAALGRPSDDQVCAGGKGLAALLRWIVLARHNIIVTGSTSAGKTTLLNAIAAEIPSYHRVGTLEDTAELKITAPNFFGFEANATFGVSIRVLVKHALRYRPNRLIVGEVRDEAAFDMLDAYNTGHQGSMVSFHADSAPLALARLENMVRMAPEAANWPLADLRRQIASTFRFVIHASSVNGQRAPQEVIEVMGVKDGEYVCRSLFRKSLSPNVLEQYFPLPDQTTSTSIATH